LVMRSACAALANVSTAAATMRALVIRIIAAPAQLPLAF
jgi:hypothetical protein